MKAALLALPAALLMSTVDACVSNHLRLDVTFYTQIAADGSCTRRTEYHLTRHHERDKKNPGFEAAPKTDPLRSAFLFPSGDRWTRNDKGGADTHDVSLDAYFTSPNDLDWDYWRMRPSPARPARNHVSFGMADGEYEYSELVADPNHPAATMRKVADLLEASLDAYAAAAAADLADRGLTKADVRAAYDTHCMKPMRRELALIDRPIFGPAERKRLHDLLDSKCDQAVEAALQALSPGDPEPIHEALEKAGNGLGFDKDLERAGISLDTLLEMEGLDPDSLDIQFHATVVMPAPIVQANACFQGDTAHWDFSQRDLYGRGFEMRVLARMPPP